MAFEVKKINPLDLQPRKAVGINLPFTGKAVFNSTYQTKDATRVNLINFLLTNKGERYLNPTFGSNIRLMLFKNINQDTLDEIEDMISEDISNYFPKVNPTALKITSSPDTNTVRFYLKYKIIESNIEDELLINIEQ
jgi:phage baseplate assembly protein W